jgi:hypothetical protein
MERFGDVPLVVDGVGEGREDAVCLAMVRIDRRAFSAAARASGACV